MSTTFLSIDKLDPQADLLEGVKIPSTLKSDSRLRPINTRSRIVVMSNVNGNTINSEGGIILFNCPSQGYIKPNSVYVRFSVAPISTGGTLPCVFKGATSGCGAVVNRSTVSFAGQVCDVLNSYEKVYSQTMGNFTSRSYLYTNGNVTQGTMNDVQGDSAGIAQAVPGTVAQHCMISTPTGANVYRYAMPVLNAIFNGQQAIPAFLINGGISVQLDLNSAVNAIQQNTSAITSLQFSDIQIVYEELMLDHDVMLAIKQEMAETGKLYELNTTGTIVFKNAIQATDTQNTFVTNLNLRSVKSMQMCSVLQNESSSAQPDGAVNAGFFLDPNTGGQTTINGYATTNLIIDGQSVYQYQLNNPAVQNASLKDCGIALYDTNSTTCSNLYSLTAFKYGSFATCDNSWQKRFYSLGYNLRKDNGSDTTFKGTRVGTLQHQFTRGNTLSVVNNLNNYYLVHHDKLICLDAQGGVIIIQ